jgi:hypothetical protein
MEQYLTKKAISFIHHKKSKRQNDIKFTEEFN